MTNSANEPLPVGHETAINDDTAEFDPLTGSADASEDRRHGENANADEPREGEDEGAEAERPSGPGASR